MRKFFIVFILMFLFVMGCENKEEKVKNEYLSMKADLLSHTKFLDSEDLICDIVLDIDRVDDEGYLYKMKIFNPKENMYNIKALLVHNYYTEDIFPSIGLFNDSKSLLVNTGNEIVLSGNIKTDRDIDNLFLRLKLLLRYTDDNGNKKDIYYLTTK